MYNQQAFKYVIERFFNDKINQIQIKILRILKIVSEICRHNFHVNRHSTDVTNRKKIAQQRRKYSTKSSRVPEAAEGITEKSANRTVCTVHCIFKAKTTRIYQM